MSSMLSPDDVDGKADLTERDIHDFIASAYDGMDVSDAAAVFGDMDFAGVDDRELATLVADVAGVTTGEALAMLEDTSEAADTDNDGSAVSFAASVEVPMADDAQILYPDEAQAEAAAEELGMGAAAHPHDLDGETWYMPAADHETFNDAIDSEAHGVEVGDTFRDELNNEVHRVTDLTSGVAVVEADDAAWRERVTHIMAKVATGDYTPEGDTSLGPDVSREGKALDECVQSVLEDNPDYSESRAYAICNAQMKSDAASDADAVSHKAEFSEGDAVTWSWQGNPVHGRVAEVRPEQATVGGNTITGDGDEPVYVIDEYDDADGGYQSKNVAKPESSLDESQRDLPPRSDENYVASKAVDHKAEFGVGDPVRWTWQGNPVHGRVAEVRPEQATVSGNTITGDEDEPVYIIDEYDERVDMLRRENVAKPESSLDASRADIPERRETNYAADSEYDSLTTVVSESDFRPRELDALAADHPDVLMKCRAGEWLSAADPDRPVIYKADIPDKYLDKRDEDFFVPNAGMADAARKVEEWEDEHGDDVAGGASDGEGARRRAQIIDHHDRGEPLAIDYWEEIANYHSRHRAQDSHELDAEYEDTPWKDAGYVSDHNWGSDAGYEQAQRVMDLVEEVEQEAAVTLEGAVATEQRVSPDTITEADTNKVDLEALEGELREAVEADDFYIYGKASIEQWDADDPPTYIQMDALENALDRFFESEHAPGIISRHHQDIPVGTPVREFEFESDTTLEIDGDTYEFEAGDTAASHVEDADGDGRPELWLAANIGNDTEMGKKTRILSAQGDLNGFSVTVHRNEDEMTSEGRMVTECDLHAVTIGTDEQIKNKGSEYDVASFKGPVRRVKDVISGLLG